MEMTGKVMTIYSRSDDSKFALKVVCDVEDGTLHAYINPDPSVIVPFALECWRSRGVLELGDADTRMFLEGYVVPPERTGIERFLELAGLERYDLFDMFSWTYSHQDLMDLYRVETISPPQRTIDDLSR